MKVEIIKILDRGIANKERLWLRVLANTNLCYFLVFDTTYSSSNQISNLLRHSYWFPTKDVRVGDYIVLYTGIGKPSEIKNNDGSTTHFLFWGLNETIWNKDGDCAILFEINTWQTSKYGS